MVGCTAEPCTAALQTHHFPLPSSWHFLHLQLWLLQALRPSEVPKDAVSAHIHITKYVDDALS